MKRGREDRDEIACFCHGVRYCQSSSSFLPCPSNVPPSCIDERLVGVAGKCFRLEEISLYEERGSGIGKISTRRKLLTTSPRNRCYIQRVSPDEI